MGSGRSINSSPLSLTDNIARLKHCKCSRHCFLDMNWMWLNLSAVILLSKKTEANLIQIKAKKNIIGIGLVTKTSETFCSLINSSTSLHKAQSCIQRHLEALCTIRRKKPTDLSSVSSRRQRPSGKKPWGGPDWDHLIIIYIAKSGVHSQFSTPIPHSMDLPLLENMQAREVRSNIPVEEMTRNDFRQKRSPADLQPAKAPIKGT